MGLLPLQIFYSFSAVTDYRLKNLTSKIDSGSERVNILHMYAVCEETF